MMRTAVPYQGHSRPHLLLHFANLFLLSISSSQQAASCVHQASTRPQDLPSGEYQAFSDVSTAPVDLECLSLPAESTDELGRWTLLAPKLEQQQSLPMVNPRDRDFFRPGGSPESFLQHEMSFDAFTKLFKPHTLSPSPASARQSPRLKAPTSSSRLESIPSEMIRNVIADLDLDDLVALGLCSQRLWAHVVPQIHRHYRNGYGTWARTPIVCTGTYLEDLPQAVFDILPEVEARFKEWNPNASRYRNMSPARRWNWTAVRDFTQVPPPEDDEQYKVRQTFEKLVQASNIPSTLHAPMRDALDKLHPDLWPNHTLLFLRNHTTRHFVRMRLTSDPQHKAVVEGSDRLTLDALLIRRICWSLPNDMRPHPVLTPEASLKRGEWAGHAFDLVDEPSFEEREKWEDITATVAEVADA